MSLRTTASTAFDWVGYAWYIVKLVFVALMYWTIGCVISLCLLGGILVYFNAPKSDWIGLLFMALPPIGGIGVITRYWPRIKKEAAQLTLLPEKLPENWFEDMIEAAGQCLALVVCLLMLGAGLLLLWGGFALLAALPISVAIIVGAILIALAIVAVASA